MRRAHLAFIEAGAVFALCLLLAWHFVLGDSMSKGWNFSNNTCSASRPAPHSHSISHHSGPSPSLSPALQAILNPEDTHFNRLNCTAPNAERYGYLAEPSASKKKKYFFAMDLFECAPLLPRLLGSVMEAIKFLGPENCVLSIVEGRSKDGTFEILDEMRNSSIGVEYHLTTNGVNPKAGGDVDRIDALAALRNQAMQPMLDNAHQFDSDASIIFINDVALCAEDILELIHQRDFQNADMTCAMDWIYAGEYFYDIWVGRSMMGDTFFSVPKSGSWDNASNLFWNDKRTKARFEAKLPFQVFSCWNGATVFTAKPWLEQQIAFRSNHKNECYLGEPVHWAKDMWKLGYGKIAVVPSVNVGYNDADTENIKRKHGYTNLWTGRNETTDESLKGFPSQISWRDVPPRQIKCCVDWKGQSWVSWDQ